jgi:hypothetical protein
MKKEDVDTFEKLVGQIQSIYDELALLSKKSPNDALNKFKLGFVNKLLESSNIFLKEIYKPFAEFSTFDEDDLPTNSDVVFILTQYLQCFEKFRADNVHQKLGNWYWTIESANGDDDNIKTVCPKRLKA